MCGCVAEGFSGSHLILHSEVLCDLPHLTHAGALKQLADEWPNFWQLKHCGSALEL
jgi:hypothetical protein